MFRTAYLLRQVKGEVVLRVKVNITAMLRYLFGQELCELCTMPTVRGCGNALVVMCSAFLTV